MFQTFLDGANRTTFTGEIIKNVLFMLTQKLNAPCIVQQGQVTPVVGCLAWDAYLLFDDPKLHSVLGGYQMLVA